VVDKFEALRPWVQEVLPIFGKVGAADNHAGVYVIDTSALESVDDVVEAGVTAGMPKAPNPPEWVPLPETLEIVTRPSVRQPRKPVTHFEILTPAKQPKWPGAEVAKDPEAETEEEAEEEAAEEEEEGSKEAEEDKVEEDETPGEMLSQSRWSIPAGGAVQAWPHTSPPVCHFLSAQPTPLFTAVPTQVIPLKFALMLCTCTHSSKFPRRCS